MTSMEVSEFEALRQHLMSVAYRLTGTVADAEDIVQEAWLRWDSQDTVIADPRPPFRAEMGCFCVCSAQVQEVAKNSLRGVPESVVMSYSYFVELPRLEDIEPGAHTDVLIANSRVDQGRIRAAVEAVFDAHPALGTVFEPRVDTLTSRPGGGGWGWGVEPPGAAVAEVIARHSASFDMYTGRLFAVSLLPGSPDRLVLTASRLCVDDASWQTVVEDLVRQYDESVLVPAR